jgi:hypothetical protein
VRAPELRGAQAVPDLPGIERDLAISARLLEYVLAAAAQEGLLP